MQTCTFQDSKGDKRTLDIHPQTMDENGEGIQDLIRETYISFVICMKNDVMEVPMHLPQINMQRSLPHLFIIC
jgi:hypothetical protein